MKRLRILACFPFLAVMFFFTVFVLLPGFLGAAQDLRAAESPAVDRESESNESRDSKALALLVQTLDRDLDSSVRAALLRGMLAGLAGQRSVHQPVGWPSLAAELENSDNEEVRRLTLQLSQVFGDAAAARQMLAMLSDASGDIEIRRTALASLLEHRNPEVSDLLETLIDQPSLRLESIRGYAAIENARAPEILLQRYDRWDPPTQRAAIETLATRKPYARALLKALQSQAVSRDDLPTHVVRSMGLILGDSFFEVVGDVRQLDADREQLMAKYKKMVTPKSLAAADAARGRVVFEKTCGACHLLYGKGGKIGPDLTGSNRANLDYILLNSVDPSFDVPDGYKMELVQTVDGRIINGVIAEEDDRRLVLKTVEQPRVVIAKDDIEERKTSALSMMPDGQLEQMKPQQVLDLIKYLRSTQQVELPQ